MTTKRRSKRTGNVQYAKGARARRSRAAETMAAYLPVARVGERAPDLHEQVDARIEEIAIVPELVALREDRGLSQSQLASLLGVSQPAIAKLESGRIQNLELRTLVRYATALGARIVIQIERLAATRRAKRTD
jgi:predicted XRE-type DNA-binding protein